jgi:hypothetical protein
MDPPIRTTLAENVDLPTDPCRRLDRARGAEDDELLRLGKLLGNDGFDIFRCAGFFSVPKYSPDRRRYGSQLTRLGDQVAGDAVAFKLLMKPPRGSLIGGSIAEKGPVPETAKLYRGLLTSK